MEHILIFINNQLYIISDFHRIGYKLSPEP